MTLMTVRMTLLAGAAMAALAGPAMSLQLAGPSEAASAREASTRYAAAQCMTDDGYGRRRSCSRSYKADNPYWRASDSCFSKDADGRKRPCSVGYKKKRAK